MKPIELRVVGTQRWGGSKPAFELYGLRLQPPGGDSFFVSVDLETFNKVSSNLQSDNKLYIVAEVPAEPRKLLDVKITKDENGRSQVTFDHEKLRSMSLADCITAAARNAAEAREAVEEQPENAYLRNDLKKAQEQIVMLKRQLSVSDGQGTDLAKRLSESIKDTARLNEENGYLLRQLDIERRGQALCGPISTFYDSKEHGSVAALVDYLKKSLYDLRATLTSQKYTIDRQARQLASERQKSMTLTQDALDLRAKLTARKGKWIWRRGED